RDLDESGVKTTHSGLFHASINAA
ncbi:MAG: hypothetical protein K0Q73_4956, partial [Paenibacillus sp.]|nr:hypothetical protein [Paenibacillus sp.]